MTAASRTHSEAHGHEHRDVSGGWLRPSVFGAMDGLVTNVSLIAGVGGGGVSAHTVVLTGLAGLAAGAFSMADRGIRLGLLAERAGRRRGPQGALGTGEPPGVGAP